MPNRIARHLKKSAIHHHAARPMKRPHSKKPTESDKPLMQEVDIEVTRSMGHNWQDNEFMLIRTLPEGGYEE
jgi:hypothetical protein